MNPITRDELAELLGENRIRPRLKRDLRFVPEEITDWKDRDFLAVTNRSRTEGVLVVPLKTLTVLPFRLSRRTPNQTGRTEAIICDFCASWQSGTHSAVLTFELASRSISYLVCADLSCSLHVRDKTPEAARSRTQLRETISVDGRIERLKERIATIVKELKPAS